MSPAKNLTIEFIKQVALALGELNDKAVYVGGATVPFYLTDEMKVAARPTEDVDVVIEVISSGNRGKIDEQLRQKGFKHDITQGAPICRWKFNDLTVDIMSPDEKAMGFSNKWYPDGVKQSKLVKANGLEVRILTLPYFLATKIEAFKGRGNDDFIGSPDMEDIITILDGAPTDQLEDEFKNIESNLKKYLKKELAALASDLDFQAALPGAVFDRANAKERSKAILKRISDLSSI